MSSELKNKAVNGMIWQSADKFGSKIVQFAIGIIIARILSPDDFGIIGLLALFISISETILDSGFANALIQKQDRTNTDYSTALYFNIVIGLLMYGVMWVISPLIADFYEIPILCSISRVYALSFVINSLSIVQTAKLSAELNFKLQSIVSLITVATSSIIGVIAAYNSFGIWALVMQQLSAVFLRMTILWICAKWVPSLVFSWQSFKSLFSFGSKILCSGLINTIYNNMYAIVIGKAFTSSEVGHFNRGAQFADMPTTTLMSVVSGVNYPILASIQNDDEALRKAYIKFLRSPLFILYPILTTMIVLAEPMVVALIGEKWLPCVPILQISCFGAMWNPLTTVNLNLLYVKGRTDKVLKLEFIKKPIGFLILFSMIPLGLFWLCAGRSLYNFVAFACNCFYTNKYLNLGFWMQLRCILPILGYCAIMAIIMVSLSVVLHLNVWATLFTISTIGFATYAIIALLNKDESLNDIMDIIKSKLKR